MSREAINNLINMEELDLRDNFERLIAPPPQKFIQKKKNSFLEHLKPKQSRTKSFVKPSKLEKKNIPIPVCQMKFVLKQKNLNIFRDEPSNDKSLQINPRSITQHTPMNRLQPFIMTTKKQDQCKQSNDLKSPFKVQQKQIQFFKKYNKLDTSSTTKKYLDQQIFLDQMHQSTIKYITNDKYKEKEQETFHEIMLQRIRNFLCKGHSKLKLSKKESQTQLKPKQSIQGLNYIRFANQQHFGDSKFNNWSKQDN